MATVRLTKKSVCHRGPAFAGRQALSRDLLFYANNRDAKASFWAKTICLISNKNFTHDVPSGIYLVIFLSLLKRALITWTSIRKKPS